MKEMDELAVAIIEDGQPERAIINYLSRTFELVNGIKCIDDVKIDFKNIEKSQLKELKMDLPTFIHSLKFAIQFLEDSDNE